MGNDALKGILISRFKNTKDMRVSIAGSFVDVADVFTNEWNCLIIQKYSNYTVSVYKNNLP